MSLRLHHVFCFVPPGASRMDELVRAGFLEGSPNRHPGQGTANRRVFFENGMVELIWAEDEAELRAPITAPTRLWERSRWQATGASPIGIALCEDDHRPEQADGTQAHPPGPSNTRRQEPPPFAGRRYVPPFFPPPLTLWQADQPLVEPAIFFLDGARPWGPDLATREPLAHPNGARRLSAITLVVPEPPRSQAALLLAALPEVVWVVGPTPRLEVAFDEPVPNLVLPTR